MRQQRNFACNDVATCNFMYYDDYPFQRGKAAFYMLAPLLPGNLNRKRIK